MQCEEEKARILSKHRSNIVAVTNQSLPVYTEPSKEAIAKLRSLITRHENFPKSGIVFRDFFPLLLKPSDFSVLVDAFASHVISEHKCFLADGGPIVDAVVGLDARGFLIGPQLAARLNCAFIPVRKAGKLPGETIEFSFSKEYGDDVFAVQKNRWEQVVKADGTTRPMRIIIVDDVLATGGTLRAAIELVNQTGAIPLECLCVLDIAELDGKNVVERSCNVPVWTLFTFTDNDM